MGDVVDVEDEVAMLGDGVGDINDGGLLEGIGAYHSTRDLAGDSRIESRRHRRGCRPS